MAESKPPRDLPQVPDSVDQAIRKPLSRVIEEVQRLLEFRGDPMDAALTLRKAYARGLVDNLGRALTGNVTYVNTFPTTSGGGGDAPDLTPPPTVTGLAVTAGFTQVLVEFDAPVYVQGHGNLQTNIYANKKATTDATLPVFADAVLVFSAPGALNVVSIPSELNTRWHVWAKYKTVDGVESVTAAGGVNGVVATTGQDIVQLLEVLTGSITESQLYTDLGQEIDLIKELSEGQNENAENTLRALLAVQDVSDGTYAAILEEKSIRRDQTGALFAQWTVKIDVNGYVSGFGLASTSAGATPYSSFIVRADSFAVASPSGPGITPAVPFIVRTTGGTEGGVPYTAGVYMVDAFILNGSIVNAKIANLAVDDAKVASMSVAKLIAGSLAVGQYAQSTGYVPGSAGWRINGNGTAEFSGVIVRGTIYAAAGVIGGNTIDASGVESPAYSAGTLGWRVDSDGSAEFNEVTVRGTVVASAGAIGGAVINTTGVESDDYVADTSGWRLDNALGKLFAMAGKIGGWVIDALSLRLGATGYLSGTGIWAGLVSGVPKAFIGNATGPRAWWDGTDLFINTPTFEPFTATITGGDLTATGPAFTYTYGTRSVAVEGGKAPYEYVWVVSNASAAYIASGGRTATVTLAGSAADPVDTITVAGIATAIVKDANGRATFASFNFSATHSPSGGGGA